MCVCICVNACPCVCRYICLCTESSEGGSGFSINLHLSFEAGSLPKLGLHAFLARFQANKSPSCTPQYLG